MIRKLILFVFFEFLFASLNVFTTPKISIVQAANGCGGTSWCGSTKVVPDYSCREILNPDGSTSCQRFRSGQHTVDCNASENSCMTDSWGTQSCDANCNVVIIGHQPESCCTNGSGGWGCECGQNILDECKKDCQGGTQGDWCGYTNTGADKYMCRTTTCISPCTPSCSATIPTNLAINKLSSTSVSLSWTPGAGNTKQLLRFGANHDEVMSGCPGTSSPVCNAALELPVYTQPSDPSVAQYMYYVRTDQNPAGVCKQTESQYTSIDSCETNLAAHHPSRTTGVCYTSANSCNNNKNHNYYYISGLSTGTVHYARVVDYVNASCYRETTSPVLTSCSLTPNPMNIYSGDTQTLTSQVNSSASLSDFNYTSSNSAVATLGSPVLTYPYQTTVNGVSAGSVNISSEIYFTNGSLACTASSVVNVSNPPVYSSWWQAKDGDILAANGNVTSVVPSGNYLLTAGLGGYPGVSILTDSLTYSPGDLSTTNWKTFSQTSQPRIFNYNFFSSNIPSDVSFNNVVDLQTGGSGYSDGYEYFKVTGDYTISGNINFGTRKVVLLVESGNLTINGNLTLIDGSGFFLTIVNGNISTSATNLEGLYLSDGSFNSGSSTSQLTVRGSVVALTGPSLGRSLANNNQPAELFEYAPDQIMLFPKKLAFKQTKWVEVAP